MRVQDLLGWMVPFYVIVWSAAGLVVSLSNRRYGEALLSLAGLAFGGVLTLRLMRRRQEWLRSRQSESDPAPPARVQ